MVGHPRVVVRVGVRTGLRTLRNLIRCDTRNWFAGARKCPVRCRYGSGSMPRRLLPEGVPAAVRAERLVGGVVALVDERIAAVHEVAEVGVGQPPGGGLVDDVQDVPSAQAAVALVGV